MKSLFPRLKLLFSSLSVNAKHGSTDTKFNREMRFLLLEIMLVFGLCTFLFMGIANWIEKSLFFIVFDASVFVVLLVFLLLLRKKSTQRWLPIVLSLFLVGLTLYLYIDGGINETGYLWVFALPTYIFYLLGLRKGLIITSGVYFFLVAISFIEPLENTFSINYSDTLLVRFFVALSIVILFTTFTNSIRSIVSAQQQLLHKKQRKLISRLKQSRKKIKRIAFTDTLTGVYNRRMFLEQLKSFLEQGKRHNQRHALIFIDLDNFKDINDNLGHAAGDSILKDFSMNLKKLLRKSDIIGRIGGDEFVVLLTNIKDFNHVQNVTEKLKTRSTKNIQYDQNNVEVRFSQGIAFYPDDGASPDSILKAADLAMYSGKANKKNSITFFNTKMNEKLDQRIHLESELRNAIEHNQFLLYLQPQHRISDNCVCGYEMLLRWNHPDQGLTYPGYFLDYAEETGMICEIGKLGLNEALEIQKIINPHTPTPLKQAYNLSARQLNDDPFITFFKDYLFKHRDYVKNMELEITESVLLENREEITDLFKQITELNATLSIDDFGTGYSSFNYLYKFNVDTLKIDKSFVHLLDSEGEYTTIVRAIIAMAHGLGLKVVAEGIETKNQLEILKKLDCDIGQGYFYAKPMPVTDFIEYLQKQKFLI